MATKSNEWFRTAILAELWDEEAKQRIMSETPWFNMMGSEPINNNQTSPFVEQNNLNREVEIWLWINPLVAMTDEEKQAYADSLSDSDWRKMNTLKNQWYSFEAAKALVENQDRFANVTAESKSKYNPKWNFVSNVVWWAYDSATWIPRMLAKWIANAVWWTAKQLWADEAKTDALVQNYKDYLDSDWSWQSLGANTDSLTYKWSKLLWDLGQTFAYWTLWKVALESKLWVPLATASDPLRAKSLAWATEWAADMWIYSMVSDSELPSAWDLALWWILWAAAPMLWAWVKAVTNATKKWSVKMAEDFVWSMNKLSKTEQNTFLKNVWENVNKWMNDRWIKSWEDLINYFNTSKWLVDDALEKIEWRYASKTLTDVLEWVKKTGKDWVELKWIVKYAEDTRDPLAWRLAELMQKNKEWWLTMSEINEVKRYFEKYYKMHNPKINQQWVPEKYRLWTNMDNELREWQRSIAEQAGFSDLAKLNKETQAAKYIMDRVKVQDPSWITFSLSDWMVLLEGIKRRGPIKWSLSMIPKKILETNWFKSMSVDVLNRLWWHKNVNNLVTDALWLSEVSSEKELKKWLSLKRDDIWDATQDMVIAWAENLND